MPITDIRPAKGWMPLNLRELWEYRELLYFFVWRDLKVRYKQTALGVAWAVLQPLLMTVVFSVIFGIVFQIQTPVPYPVFAMSGLLGWNLFARGLSEASTSLSSSRDLVTKVYFPRLMLPMAEVLAGLVDFAIALGLLAGLMVAYNVPLTLTILALPFFLLIAVLSALGISFWFSALDARYRDVRYMVPFLVQLWFFVTPVIYPIKFLPQSLQWVLSLNPMVGVVDGIHWAFFGESFSFDAFAWISTLAVLLIFVGGLYYFRRVEKIMADVV